MDAASDIVAYHEALDAEARPICDRLLAIMMHELADAEHRVWHAHPVWFFDGNPIAGYDRLKRSVRLLFWSGQSFRTPGLSAEGSFKAAEIRFASVDEIDDELIRRWLAEAREIQWNYREIRRNRGLVPLRGLPGAPA